MIFLFSTSNSLSLGFGGFWKLGHLTRYMWQTCCILKSSECRHVMLFRDDENKRLNFVTVLRGLLAFSTGGQRCARRRPK